MDVIAKAEQVHAAACELGEGPVWDTRRQGLWFVDIKRHQVRHFDPVGQSHVSFTAPGQVGWVLPCTDGSLLAGLHDGLHVLDPNKGEFDPLWEVPGEPAGNRLNDACTDTVAK